MTRILLLAALAASLSGCATHFEEPPAGAPSATVVFSNVSAPGMVEFFSHGDNEECGDIQIIRRAFSVHQGEKVPVRFPTSGDLTLSAIWNTPVDSCRIFVTFRPVAGERYAALYGNKGEKCGFIVLHDRTRDGGTLEPEPSFRVRNANPMLFAKGCPREKN